MQQTESRKVDKLRMMCEPDHTMLTSVTTYRFGPTNHNAMQAAALVKQPNRLLLHSGRKRGNRCCADVALRHDVGQDC